MATFWKGSSITANGSSSFITVQTGDDISSIKENSLLMVSNFGLPIEVKRAYMNSSVPTIELFENFPATSSAGLVAVIAPSAAAIAQASIDLQVPLCKERLLVELKQLHLVNLTR